MNTRKQDSQSIAGKKAYEKPCLKKLGGVSQLTLKIGSNTDGMNGHLE